MTLKTSFRRGIAGLGILALGVGLAMAAPLSASAATTTYSLDCNDLPYNDQTFYVVPGDDVTFNLTGFTELYDYDTGLPAATLDPAGSTVVVTPADSFEFWDPSNACTEYFDPTVEDAAPETIPSGGLLFTQNITVAPPAPQITVADNSGGDGDHYLNGDPDCAISTNVHGIHVYSTLKITVLVPGVFTFRGLNSTPAGDYSPLAPFDPIGDPFLAVYSAFNPASPDTGVVGCNDDLNDIGPQNDAEYRTDGTFIDGHQPYFTASFTPGQYTLVLMTYDDLSAADLAAGYDQYEDESFEVGPKTTRFELWGPAGGLALGGDDVDAPAGLPGDPLVATGVDGAAIVTVGAFALMAGALFMLLGRRRSPRGTVLAR